MLQFRKLTTSHLQMNCMIFFIVKMLWHDYNVHCNLQALENLRQELNHYQPISQRKRTTIAGFLVFLMVISGVSGILTVAADREFQRVNEDPFASEHEAKKSHIVFSICLSFLFFCLTLTMAISILWFILETYFYIHRRRVLNQATSRMVREARRRSALWGTAVL